MSIRKLLLFVLLSCCFSVGQITGSQISPCFQSDTQWCRPRDFPLRLLDAERKSMNARTAAVLLLSIGFAGTIVAQTSTPNSTQTATKLYDNFNKTFVDTSKWATQGLCGPPPWSAFARSNTASSVCGLAPTALLPRTQARSLAPRAST